VTLDWWLWRLVASTALMSGALLALLCARWRSRARRRYVRLRVDPYRTDRASAEAIVAMFEALHKRLLRRWWRRLLEGQPSLSLEIHHDREAWLALTCPPGCEATVEAALRGAYPNCRLSAAAASSSTPPPTRPRGRAPVVLRLEKQMSFIKRVKVLDRFEHEREPAINALLTAMGAERRASFVQLAMTPAPALFERYAKGLYKHHEGHLSRERREHLLMRDRSMVDDSELRGGLDVQHRPLFFVDLRVVGPDRPTCERIAAQLRAASAENHLVERGTVVRHGLLGLYARRVRRGEGNPLPSLRRGVFASTELAAIWHLPSVEYATVPFQRNALPLAPASPAIMRPRPGAGAGAGAGTLCDALGPVSIHTELRRQNTAVPGTVEQGKSSYLVATVAEDLLRERCAVIVFDPKGDAADAAVGLVPESRTCTLLDFAHPTCGFNPLAVDAPADVIADYVVAALRNLFTDADIRASSDRYLRNAIIAVLAHGRESTLWDAARLLSVGEEGYAYRTRVGARVRALPEFKEISEFFTAELTAQLADARSMTTAKLDAPVNKLARLLNSPSIKRVLLNDSLTVDFERVIAGGEVLVVKGALGAMGAGNTSVLMQLLIGMLDAALARQQDLVAAGERIAVALKVDEAPLVLNRGFADTMALKRSAGLETVACWQADSQWTDREVRAQLDALFAHRVYFATASVQDARDAAGLLMAEYADSVRPNMESLSALGRPDARLRLPKHHAIVSWTTPQGRQPPFVAQTLPIAADRARMALHAERQRARGGAHRTELTQPHWDREQRAGADAREARPERRWVLPAVAAESYRELALLGGAQTARRLVPPERPRALELEPLDLEILALVASVRHVLSSQIHRRFNPGRATSTTQRRLKRLADAALLSRFQLHSRDGGGVPMCYAIAPAGARALAEHGRLDAGVELEEPQPARSRQARTGTGSGGERDRALAGARRDVHAAAWALAVQVCLEARSALRGPGASAIPVPSRSTPDGPRAIGPHDLRLPGGRTPHEFLRSLAGGARGEVERFETVRPALTLELPPAPTGGAASGAVDLLVELDDRLAREGEWRALAKLERYDHFLSGWRAHTARYGERSREHTDCLVIFVCRDRATARRCAERADGAMTACQAYAGEYPVDWLYPGRERVLFAAERDAHEGMLCAYGVHPLPPAVRASAAHGDPRARAPRVRMREISIGHRLPAADPVPAPQEA